MAIEMQERQYKEALQKKDCSKCDKYKRRVAEL